MKKCDKDAASVFIQARVLTYCQIIFVNDCLQSVKKYTGIRLMQSSSVSRRVVQCLDAITLSVMYSFKKVAVTEYNFQTGNSQTLRRKSLKIILIIC